MVNLDYMYCEHCRTVVKVKRKARQYVLEDGRTFEKVELICSRCDARVLVYIPPRLARTAK
ncbi:MAG: hypothetical protein JRJ12_11470 [Deltaproteobacteria bacterium]|nr:hypothetical protein [Deltaproteobacteria bacterium]MBW2071679.1 hypothetical protein [Deltaproteobacteria bacterium]